MNILSNKSNQSPKTITFFSKAQKKEITVDMNVGMGATMHAGSDCYPYTVWGWRTTKSGKLYVYVIRDEYTATNQVASGEEPNYNYTSIEPSNTHSAVEINLSAPRCYFTIGNRRFYQDPSF